MHTTTLFRLSVVIAALAIVGCGDGQRGRNSRNTRTFNKNLPAGTRSALNKGTGAGNAADGDAKVFSTGVDAKKQSALNSAIALLDQGTEVGVGSNALLPPGAYVLTGWTSVFQSGNPWVQAIKSTILPGVSRPDAVLAQLAQDQTWVGALKDGTATSTASITLPAQFTIAENTIQPDQTKRALTVTVNVKNKQLTVTDELADAAGATTAADVMTTWDQRRLGQPVVQVDDVTTFEIKSVKQTDAEHLRIAVVLLRTPGGANAATDNSVTKTFYLTYASMGAAKRDLKATATPAPATPTPGELGQSAALPDANGSRAGVALAQ